MTLYALFADYQDGAAVSGSPTRVRLIGPFEGSGHLQAVMTSERVNPHDCPCWQSVELSDPSVSHLTLTVEAPDAI